MNYYELRSIVSRIIPRFTQLLRTRQAENAVREKGRKSGYQQFNLKQQEWVKQERLLNTEEINSFLEISIRAQACPMPLNIDTYDALLCPFNCIYCFANSFRASLYTAFFDNSKTVGIRQCNPDYYKRELDKIMANREKPPESLSHVNKAIAMGIPIRFGIRFEDFLYAELKRGVSLELLRYLSDLNYPVMINTKSDVVGRDEYVRALADNRGKAAVHITMISSNNKILKDLEPGAPSFEKRLEAGRALTEAGVRVVARIEPFLVFINDHPDDVQDYMERVWQAGIRHITFDTYSYTAHDPGIRSTFISQGYDWDRLFLLGCDSQGLGSLLLGKFMEMFQERGFQCSTFDMGNMPINNQTVCCEVGDWFEGGFNYGCTVVAARYIRERGLAPTSWHDFETYVNAHGGFLTEALKADVKRLWNIEGNNAYSPNWSAGIEPCGRDEHGIIWNFKPNSDFRQDILEGLI